MVAKSSAAFDLIGKKIKPMTKMYGKTKAIITWFDTSSPDVPVEVTAEETATIISAWIEDSEVRVQASTSDGRSKPFFLSHVLLLS